MLSIRALYAWLLATLTPALAFAQDEVARDRDWLWVVLAVAALLLIVPALMRKRRGAPPPITRP